VDIQTVLGITWYKASAEDVLLVLGLLMVPIAFIIIAKLLQRLKYKRVHEEQLFLFRLKRLGLSNFQIKIINNLLEILEFSNPNQLFDDPEYFEAYCIFTFGSACMSAISISCRIPRIFILLGWVILRSSSTSYDVA